MNRAEAYDLIEATMKQHLWWREEGATWHWATDLSMSHGAITYYGPRAIVFSRHYLDAAPRENVLNTILHEIAHVLAGHHAAHGPEWRAICLELGGNGERCHGVELDADLYKVRADCDCGTPHLRVRMPRKGYAYACKRTGAPLTYYRTDKITRTAHVTH